MEPRLHSTLDGLKDVLARIGFIQGDMLNERLIGELVCGQDVIFNCAAQTSHPLSIKEPLFDAQINCLGNLKVLEAVRRYNPTAVIVYTSSSTVIGKAVGDVVDETHGERPLDIYSANKGVAEKYYRIYSRVHDLKTVMLRFANLYGPYGKGYSEFGFINYFIDLARRDGEIPVFGAGDQTRNVLYVEDACDILLRSAFEPRLIGEVFYAVSDEHLSVLEIAQTIVRVLGRGRVTQVAWPDERRRIEVERVLISSARLREITRWRPRYSFEEGLARTKEVLERSLQP
jgi:UDP-glucose 4-epimerase